MTTRKCTFCKKLKPLDGKNFYRTNTKDFNGFMYRCKPCDQEYEIVKKDPRKERTRVQTRLLVKSGKLVKGSCEVCGNEKVDGHHPDYDNPVLVMWLCLSHHQEEHKRLRELSKPLSKK